MKKNINDLIKELSDVNRQVENLLTQIPTDDHRLVGRLYTLVDQQSRLIGATPIGKENGTMFWDQAQRIAYFLKNQYENARFDGRLYKRAEEDAKA